MYTTLLWKYGAKSSVLKAISSYRNSAAHKRMHDFDSTQQKVNKIKQDIDVKDLLKDSDQCMMIRQFLFQEEKPTINVNYSRRYSVPSGKWTIAQIQQFYEKNMDKKISDQSGEESAIIQRVFESQLKQKFEGYYKRIGKKDYYISVMEEVEKISNMTDEEFNEFIKVMETPTQF